MSPKLFLKWAGVILVVLGILGFIWPAPQAYPTFYLDGAENWAHLILGLVALAVAYWATDSGTQKWVTALFGIVALYFGVWGFVVAGNPEPNYYTIANLETLDNVVHLIVGVWGLWAAFGKS